MENQITKRKSKFEVELEKILGSRNMVFIRNITEINIFNHGWSLKLLDKKKVDKFINRGRIVLWKHILSVFCFEIF